ncbi:hypothetical protein EDM59_15000 [Brevibacillus nitrificans]|uniref:Uncharacterized protein n=1 Tax=Brevibacillus nitrificans TaxID=651560 RepID=A0A3M8D8E2_9BACL|nr:hypothetical protein EDM59_15000 [Brevibacillus nitrificans]
MQNSPALLSVRRGANDSGVHEDFMVGSDQLDIDGELADGTREPLFRQGNWIFST